MSNIYFFSGPCGCGKSTLAEAFAKHLVNENEEKEVYLIHGDDFHEGFVAKDNAREFLPNEQNSGLLAWTEIFKFSWDCFLAVTRNALARGMDVVIDYVIEEELPLVQEVAAECGANLYYVVLTASEDTIRQRIIGRGDVEMISRALFLKHKLDSMSENRGHLFDTTELSVEEEVEQLDILKFEVKEG